MFFNLLQVLGQRTTTGDRLDQERCHRGNLRFFATALVDWIQSRCPWVLDRNLGSSCCSGGTHGGLDRSVLKWGPCKNGTWLGNILHGHFNGNFRDISLQTGTNMDLPWYTIAVFDSQRVLRFSKKTGGSLKIHGSQDGKWTNWGTTILGPPKRNGNFHILS